LTDNKYWLNSLLLKQKTAQLELIEKAQQQ